MLTVITTDRFLAVHLHLRYKELVTNNRYGIAIAFIWVCSITVGVIRVLTLNQTAVVIMIILFVALLMLNAYFHARISQVIRKHSKQIREAQSHLSQQSVDMPKYKKSVNTMYYVIGAFVLCYVPRFCLLVAHFLTRQPTLALRYVSIFTETIWMSNGVLNPIIYCWRIQAIRQATCRLLRGMWSTIFRVKSERTNSNAR
jgi:hypothetical protein